MNGQEQGTEAREEAVVFSCLFQPSPARDRVSGPEAQVPALLQGLEATVAQQQKGMEVLTAQLKGQAAQIEKVSAQLEMSKPGEKVAVNKP